MIGPVDRFGGPNIPQQQTATNTPDADPALEGNVTYVGEGRVSYGGTNMSVMDAVTLLFLERSEVFSGLTKDKMNESRQNLKEIQSARKMLARMRELKAGASSKKTTTMPDDMVEYCQKNGISWDTKGDDYHHNSKEWDVNIEYMQGHLDKLTDSNQTEFLKLKSNVNKLDEAVTAANKMIEKSYDAVKNVLSR